jgi:hypothetical protein
MREAASDRNELAAFEEDAWVPAEGDDDPGQRAWYDARRIRAPATAWRRIERYWELKRLREQLGDDGFSDLELEADR